MHSFHRRVAYAMLVMALSFSFAACDATTTVTSTTGGTQPGGNTSTTPANSATPTAAAATTCAALLPGSGPASGGPNFGDIPFPPNSVTTPQVLHSSGTGQYTIYLFNACSPNTTAANVHAFYATQMLAEGWGQDPTLPFDGAYQQNCGDAYCWEKGPNPIARRLSGLESVTDHANTLVTYTWRVFVPPPQGACKASDFPSMTNASPSLEQYQLPPVTTYYDFGGAAGNHETLFCSAGDAASILAFMKKSVVAAGWKITSTSATQVNAESPDPSNHAICFTLNITAGTVAGYPGEWSQNAHPPVANCV